MRAAIKEQTAFRFDTELIVLMKTRARGLGKSVNAYVTDLIESDLLHSKDSLPKVKLPPVPDSDILKYQGVMSAIKAADIQDDDRFQRIWNR